MVSSCRRGTAVKLLEQEGGRGEEQVSRKYEIAPVDDSLHCVREPGIIRFHCDIYMGLG